MRRDSHSGRLALNARRTCNDPPWQPTTIAAVPSFTQGAQDSQELLAQSMTREARRASRRRAMIRTLRD